MGETNLGGRLRQLAVRIVPALVLVFAMLGMPFASAAAATGNQSPIRYVVTPHEVFYTAKAPQQFPAPSVCEALAGFACYTPALIRSAYNIPDSATGAGQRIVIVDAYGSPTIRQDLAVFDQEFGLPPANLTIVYPMGNPTFNPRQHHEEAGWAGETSLDVEWSHAIAPLADIVLVIAPNNFGNTLNVAQRYAVQHYPGSVMSLSFGAAEGDIAGRGNNLQLQQAHAIYQQARQNHITVFASAGDSGATNGLSFINALFPASDPLVTSVGGTALFMSDTGQYQNEITWNDDWNCPFGCTAGPFGATGGAPSVVFTAPAFQQGVSGFSSRTTADVSYNASVYTAVMVYMSFPAPGLQPGFYFFGGTSEGAPQWAGITALVNQAAGHAMGYLNPSLYALASNPATYAQDFHDVTAGNNAFEGPGYPAGTGYDLPTGLGSPNVANLIATLSGK